MKHVVVFTAHRRPEYMKQSLDSWRNVRGVDQAHMHFQCDADAHSEVVEMCQDVDFAGAVTVEVSSVRYGVQSAPWHALETGWQYADLYGIDFVMLSEEDICVSSDTLEYYSWCRDQYRDDAEILTVCSFTEQAVGGYAEVFRSSHFRSWVWGTWKDRWTALLRDSWDHNYQFKGFDWHISEYCMEELGHRAIIPARSRSQNIGQYGGVHTVAEDFVNCLSRCYSPDVEPQDYREL